MQYHCLSMMLAVNAVLVHVICYGLNMVCLEVLDRCRSIWLLWQQRMYLDQSIIEWEVLPRGCHMYTLRILLYFSYLFYTQIG